MSRDKALDAVKFRLSGALSACVCVLLVSTSCATGPGSGDPDPGGAILHSLHAVLGVVPAGSDVLVRDAGSEPRWDSCDGRPGTFGWDDITVTAKFRSDEPPVRLLSDAARHLADDGWSGPASVPSPLGAGARWTRKLPGGGIASASLTPGTYGDRSAPYWDLIAAAPPHGQRVRGC